MGEGLTRVTRVGGAVVKPGPWLGLLAESLSSLPTGRHANWTQVFLLQVGGQTLGMAPLRSPGMERGGPGGSVPYRRSRDALLSGGTHISFGTLWGGNE